VEQSLPLAAARIFVTYPARRWLAALSRVARGRPRSLPGLLVLTPLVLLGAWAASAGLFAELRALRRRHRLSKPNGAAQNL
jgi:hypothetical protein